MSSSKQINPKREVGKSFVTRSIPPAPLADPKDKATLARRACCEAPAR